MPYLKAYDMLWDVVFQTEVDADTAAKIPPVDYMELADRPFPDIPIMPRLRSEREPLMQAYVKTRIAAASR